MTFSRIDSWFDNLWDRIRGANDAIRAAETKPEVVVIPTPAASGDRNRPATNEIAPELAPRIEKFDLQAKQNAVFHHTEKYELVTKTENTAVLRRGGALRLALTLNQPVDLKKKQRLVLIFSYGPRPNPTRGTQVTLQVGGRREFERRPKDAWDVRTTRVDGNTAHVEVQIMASTPIGLWRVEAQISARPPTTNPPTLPTPTTPSTPTHSPDLSNLFIYIIFNPWSKDDLVYMEKEEHRQEYVLNDVGKIWVGSYPRPRGRQWVFGQFDDAVLPACVLLLERAGVSPETRADPVAISRAISRIVNSNDDRGVVVGKWDGDYKDGTAPTEWTGSIKILEEYMRRQRPVRYGQCWVFSGVVTTVCRALGMPCRSVTNLNSAHDTNSSLTIDEFFTKDGEDYKFNPDAENPSGLGDSIWNFHVWNDAWMARPDLPSGYGGWQAIDATPQETSDGLYQCGPASLEAVRRGNVLLPYDVPFVLAEVNADLVRWQQDETEATGFKIMASIKSHVGRQLLTKKAGTLMDSTEATEDREDCTTEYKAPEGTDTERVTLHGAARSIRSARHAFRFPSVANMDVTFELADLVTVNVGDDYAVAVKMKNTSTAVRTVQLSLSSSSEYYTGVRAMTVKRAEGSFVLQPGQEESLRLPVRYKDYIDKLVEHGMMKILAIASVKETTQTWIQDDHFQILKPNLTVETPTTSALGEPLVVKVSFTNPMKEKLTEAFIVVDGPGLTRPKKIPVPDVDAGALFTHTLRLEGKVLGDDRPLVVTFSSKQITDIVGSSNISITPQEE